MLTCIVCVSFYFPCGVYPMWAKTSHVADVQEYPSFSMTISKVCHGKTVRFTAVQAQEDMKGVRFLKYLLSAQLMDKTRLRYISTSMISYNIYLCHLHFKLEYIVSRKFLYNMFSIIKLCKCSVSFDLSLL